MTLYDALGGRPALLALAHAWHERCLADPVVSHAFSHGFRPDHVERLATYWAEALGGPTDYTQRLGNQADVVRVHSGNGEHPEMDERALACFVQAIEDAGLPADPGLRGSLTAYFSWVTGLVGTHPDSVEDVPEDLSMPYWGSISGAPPR